MRTNSRLPNSRGFREVEVVIPELEIVQSKTVDEVIMELFQKHEQLTHSHVLKITQYAPTTVEKAFKRLQRRGIVSCSKAMVRHNDVSRLANIYTLSTK